MHCSVAQCLEVVGEWWSMLILRDAFFGVTRFDDFQERLSISRNNLNQRLNHLVAAGVLDKVPYNDRPPRYEYRLTNKGLDLWPVLTAMRQWGDRYAAPDGPPIQLIHEAVARSLTPSWCVRLVESRSDHEMCGRYLDRARWNLSLGRPSGDDQRPH